MKPYYECKHGVLYHGDCLDIMPRLEGVDLVIADPPYGINMDKGFSGADGFRGKGKKIERIHYADCWDSKPPSKEHFDVMLNICKKCIIWGGNYFTDKLPIGTFWLCWDKLQTMPTFGDCELAWTNIKRKSVKKYTIEQNGLFSKDKERYHPTQKAVSLIVAVINDFSEKNNLILDPFLGSGTTAVAAINTGRRFIGIELEEKYCEIAAKRIEQAMYNNSMLNL